MDGKDIVSFLVNKTKAKGKHPKCKGYRDYWGDFDCEYQTKIDCDQCKYGGHGGRKDPAAKCNQG